MRAVIFANGQRPEPAAIHALLHPDDLLIAADGGARNALFCGLTPHLLVGDFDSLTPTELAAFRSAGVEISQFSARKDFTDLELALQAAEARGCSRALIVSALGDRWDQTLANLLLPAAFPGLEIRLVDGHQELILVRPAQPLVLHGQPGDTVSLIPLSADAIDVHTAGLEYPLQGETLFFGATRGVSNVLIGHAAQVSLAAGLLICVVIHQKNHEE